MRTRRLAGKDERSDQDSDRDSRNPDGRDLPCEHVQPGGEDQASETTLERTGGAAPAEDGASVHPDDCSAGHERKQAPVERDMADVPREAGERLEGDDEERGSYRFTQRETAENGQRGHDEKAAARPHEARHQADASTDRQHAHRRRPTPGDAAFPACSEHGEPRRQHDGCQTAEEPAFGYELCEVATCEGTEHRTGTEEATQLPPNMPSPRGEQSSDDTRRPHEEEGASDRGLRTNTHDVDEEWHRQDPPAAAEKTQHRTDEQCEKNCENERLHRVLQPANSSSASASSRVG